MALAGIRACVFDAYGTLFDVAAAAARCQDALGEKTPALAALWRDKQLQYSWLRAVQDRHADFRQVTEDALDFALAALGLEVPELEARLLRLYLVLDAFREVPETLRALRDRGLGTAILSNGTPEMLAAAVDNAELAGAFGLRAVWCNRRQQPPERLPGSPECEITTLAELPPLLATAAAGAG
jgi:2-haloacid dehalogenase